MVRPLSQYDFLYIIFNLKNVIWRWIEEIFVLREAWDEILAFSIGLGFGLVEKITWWGGFEIEGLWIDVNWECNEKFNLEFFDVT